MEKDGNMAHAKEENKTTETNQANKKMEERELPGKEFKIITKMSYELNKIMQELNENINKEIEKTNRNFGAEKR